MQGQSHQGILAGWISVLGLRYSKMMLTGRAEEENRGLLSRHDDTEAEGFKFLEGSRRGGCLLTLIVQLA